MLKTKGKNYNFGVKWAKDHCLKALWEMDESKPLVKHSLYSSNLLFILLKDGIDQGLDIAGAFISVWYSVKLHSFLSKQCVTQISRSNKNNIKIGFINERVTELLFNRINLSFRIHLSFGVCVYTWHLKHLKYNTKVNVVIYSLLCIETWNRTFGNWRCLLAFNNTPNFDYQASPLREFVWLCHVLLLNEPFKLAA